MQWKRVWDGTLTRRAFRQSYLGWVRAEVFARLRRGAGCEGAATAGVCRELLAVEPALYMFALVEGVESKNNAAERALRHAVRLRKMSFETDSAGGSRFVERVLTVGRLQPAGAGRAGLPGRGDSRHRNGRGAAFAYPAGRTGSSANGDAMRSALATGRKGQRCPMDGTRRLRWGYIDTAGRVAIDFLFDNASQFNEGLGLVKVGDLSGFIDKAGSTAIEPQFGDESNPFFDGLAMVQAATGKCGYIDKLGRYTIEPVYDWARPFSEGLALVRVSGKYGYITKNGEYLVEPEYALAGSYSEGHASVYKGDRWYVLDARGEITFGPLGSAGEFREGVASVWHEGGPALLRIDGTVVQIRGVDWLSQYFSGGRIEFSRSEKYGYMDRDGEVVVPPIYDGASTYTEGLAAVKRDGRWGYIDTSGALVIEPRFDEASFFKCGLAYVEDRGESRYIDGRGNVVLETGYKGGFPFRAGLTPVYVDEGANP
jgi:hypothetical protein